MTGYTRSGTVGVSEREGGKVMEPDREEGSLQSTEDELRFGSGLPEPRGGIIDGDTDATIEVEHA